MAVDSETTTSTPERSNPYVGPRAFHTGESLYGRDRELRDLLNYLLSQRIILLYSPSGAGKTSLIHAGLIPSLLDKGFASFPVIRVNLQPLVGVKAAPAEPEEAQAQHPFNRYTYSALLSLEEGLPDDQQIPTEELAGLSLEAYLTRRSRPAPDSASEQPDVEVLIFDQFEEILTIDPTDISGKTAFFAQVGDALRSRQRWALFSMREDYIAALDPYLRLVPTHLNNRYRLDLLGVDAARMAIQRPAEKAQVEFREEAAQKLVDDLRRIQVQRPDGSMEAQLGQYVEPVQLQVVCYRLWQNLAPEQAHIDEEDIAKTGDVNQSLSEYYAERVAAVAAQTGVRERSIRSWFEHRLITEGGIRGQVLMSPERSGELENQAIRLLEDAHLVRAEKRRGATWFELAHDRLIEPVRSSNAVWFQERLSPLQRQAELWERENRPNHLLLREQALLEARDWAEHHPDELTPGEREFLNDSQDTYQREIEAQQARQRQLEMAQKLAETEKQRAEEQARGARRLRWLVAGLFVVLLIAFGLAILASRAQRSASASAATATNALGYSLLQAATATHALGLSQIQAATATHALGLSQVRGTEAARSAATAQAASTQAIQEKNNAATAQVIAENQRATAVFSEQRIKEQAEQVLSSLSSQLAAQGVQELQADPVLAALLGVEAFRAFDTLAARELLLSTLELSQQQQLSTIGTPIQQQFQIASLATSPDGERLAWGLANGRVILWNRSSGPDKALAKNHNSPVTALAFSNNPLGTILASGDPSGNLYITDLESKEVVHINFPSIDDLAFHPKSPWLAVASGRTVRVYEISQLFVPRLENYPFKYRFPHTRRVTAIAWSPDGKYLATGSEDHSVQVWDLNNQSTPLIERRNAHKGPVSDLDWSPDGSLLASSAASDYSRSQLIVWDFPAGNQVTSFQAHGNYDTTSLSFSPDGRVLASGGDQGTVAFWDPTDWELIDRYEFNYTGEDPYRNDDVEEISFFPTAGLNLLAAAQYGGQVALTTINPQQVLSQDAAQDLGGAVLALSAQPDGGLLAAVRQDEGIQVIQIDPDGEQRVLYQLDQPARSAAFSSDGKTLAVGDTAYGRAAIYAAETGEQEGRVLFLNSPDDRAQVPSLAFSQDGAYLAGSLCVGAINEDGVCRSGPFAAVVARAENAGTSYILQGLSDFVLRPLAFAPGSLTLATGGAFETIVWDVGSQSDESALPGGSPVSSLSYSPDGRWLAIGYEDARLSLWNTATSSRIGPLLSGSPARFSSLAFNPQGDKIYAGLVNGTIQVWNLDPEAWIERACQIAGRNMSDSEWERFFPNQSYRETCSQPAG